MNIPVRSQSQRPALLTLCMGALGVVYGDIGTSPLYTVNQIFAGSYHVDVSASNILGILSLIFWSLTMVVTVKYVIFVLRADNDGEGGMMSLAALVHRGLDGRGRIAAVMSVLAILGTGLFFGDSIITPAISVLSAVEGLSVASEKFKGWTEPLALAVIVALFFIQRRGTDKIGRLFGPIIAVWFIVLAVLGINKIIQHPEVLTALNPIHGLMFLTHHGTLGFLILGAVVLSLTGAEALYADLGHFGRRPIVMTWLGLVFPALLLNYFGQGALLLSNPQAISNPFYLLAPDWALYPMVILSTAATIIASQAVISGAYSLAYQAMHMGFIPRLLVQHTTASAKGQIYIPVVNWLLFAGVVALIIGFKDSAHLANAYGLAVTGTMVVTTILIFVVMVRLWKWSIWPASLFLAVFLVIDGAFFSANLVKFFEGGWFPLAMGLAIFVLLTTWKKGRELLRFRTQEGSVALKPFLASLALSPAKQVSGLAVFLCAQPDIVPRSFLHNLAHNKVVHETVAFVTVYTEDVPLVPIDKRLEVTELSDNAYRIILRYGFMEAIDIPSQIAVAKLGDRPFNILETSFFINRETVVPSRLPGMQMWRERLFSWMMRNSQGTMTFFKIPPGRMVELGSQIEI